MFANIVVTSSTTKSLTTHFHKTMATDLPLSLDAMFSTAVSQLQRIDENWPALSYLSRTPGPSTRPDTPSSDAATTAINQLTQLSTAVAQAALLSPNESLDEISTPSLKYLLLPYLLARAHAQVQGDTYQRYATLTEAQRWLSIFFRHADQLHLMSERERDAALEETPTGAMSPAERRETKIARFKKEKETEQKLATLRECVRNSAPDDDEAERELALVVVGSAVRRALDFLDGLEQEMEVLKFAVRQLEKGIDPREKAERTKPKGKPEGMGGLPATFRIVSEREKIREGVFRPSHSLPTYTVEEWGQMEMERALKAEKEKKERNIVEAKRREEGDSDGEEAVERERVEKSRWDDWRDEHNKGSGNTIR